MRRRTLMDDVLRPGALRPRYQPIVDVSGPEPVVHGFECLVRGPEGTNLERADVLFEYVRRKLRHEDVDRACVRLGLAGAAGLPRGTKLSLNVHAFTLAHAPGLPGELRECADAAGIAMEDLVVEIVEFAPGWGGPPLLRALDAFRAAGCAVALDDIGHGESNYRMILDSRPDYFKLDRYFVNGVSRDAGRRAVVESVRDLAKRFGARLVAEGVEDARDLAFLVSAGIPLVQGFLFAPALDAPAFLAWAPGTSVAAAHACS